MWRVRETIVGIQTQQYSLFTPYSRDLIEKLNGSQTVKKFPAFYGTRRFITAFTSARYLSLSWARSIQSMPSHTTSWRSILILFSHLRLGLPSGLFLSGFPTKTLYTSVIPHTYYMARPSHSYRFYHPKNNKSRYQQYKSVHCCHGNARMCSLSHCGRATKLFRIAVNNINVS